MLQPIRSDLANRVYKPENTARKTKDPRKSLHVCEARTWFSFWARVLVWSELKD